MATRIFLASWNLDNTMFRPNDLRALLNDPNPKAWDCDIVVVGLQEAANKAGRIDLFQLHDQCNRSMASNYWSRQHELFGHTKKYDNYQVLGVLVNPAGPGTVGPPTSWKTATYGEPVVTSSPGKWLRHKTIGGEQGKGGVVAALNIHHGGRTRCFAFTSAHLDSRNPVRQNTECDLLEQVRAGLNPAPDVSFVMGDLNYRLALPPVLNGAPDPKFDRRLDQVALKMCSALGRAQLFALDTLGTNCHFATQHGYTFAPPRRYVDSTAYTYFAPTYKRKKGADPPGYRALADQAVAEVKRAYGFATEKHGKVEYIQESRGGQFDAGWLDRIGYKDTFGATYNIVAADARHDLNVSDHVPVYMVIDVT